MQDVRDLFQELPCSGNRVGEEAGSQDQQGKVHQVQDLYSQLQIRCHRVMEAKIPKNSTVRERDR
jgi:hypothetical protein